MRLVHDLLDKAVVDRNGREMGRVDRVVLELSGKAAPRVVAIEIGASALGARLGDAVGRWVAGWLHGLNADQGQPLRIPLNAILSMADKVTVDFAFGETPAANIERKLRRVIGALPGGRR